MAATVHAISSLPYELNSGVYYYFSTSLIGRSVSWWGFDSDSHTISKVDLTITSYLGSGSQYLYCIASTVSSGIRVRLIAVSSTSTTSGTTVGEYIIEGASSYTPTSEIALESAYTLYLQKPSLSYNLIRTKVVYYLSKPTLSYSLTRSKVIEPLSKPVISSYELKGVNTTLKEPIFDSYSITRSKVINELLSPVLSGTLKQETLSLKNINFYVNNSPSNMVDKDIEELFNLSGNFRQQVNILTPTFLIEYDKVPDFNYCYIPSFNRYYFITDITSIRTNVWKISCSVDVLMTYATELREQSALVNRSYSTYNSELIDNLVSFNSIIDYEIVENGVSPLFSTTGGTTEPMPYNIVCSWIAG